MDRPQVAECQKVPRELRIDGRPPEKFGHSDNCLGCLQRRMKELGHRPHSNACRRRVYGLMMSDEDEIDRLKLYEARIGRAEAARDDPSRDPQPNDELPLNSLVVVSIAVDVIIGIDDNDGIPIGQVAEDPDDDDEPMEEAGVRVR